MATGSGSVRAMHRQHGFTYLGVLLLVAATATGSTALATMWHTAAQRDREQELLAIGDEFRTAIGRYVAAGPGGRRVYPRSLDELVIDKRHTDPRRHLRRIYVDPMTGRSEWGLVRSADGGIAGVHSLSTARPFKTVGFAANHADLQGATRYADWRFVYRDIGLPGTTPARP